MERLTPQNLMFLSAEDDRQRLHVGSVGVYEGPAPSFSGLVDRVTAALPLVPRSRQRIQEVPWKLARPVWVDDVGFDVSDHVHEITLPAPVSADRLDELVGEITSSTFDRSRPLWGMWMVNGLEDGTWALVTKTHQIMVDGIAGTPLLAVLLDLTPEARDLPAVEWQPRDEPSDLRLMGDALTDLAVDPVEMGRVVQSGLRVQGAALRWAIDRVTNSDQGEPDPTGLSGPVSHSRCWMGGELDLALVRAVRQAKAASVNDIMLAVVAGGFRQLLIDRGVLAEVDHVQVAVPLPVSSGGRYENEVTVASYDLPVAVADPAERLELIETQSAALEDRGVAADVLRALAGNPSARLLALGSRVASMAVRHQHSYHSIVVNVPGPHNDRFLLGRRLLTNHPIVPLVDGIRLSVGALGLGDRIFVGLTGDPEHVDDLDVLRSSLPDELTGLWRSVM